MHHNICAMTRTASLCRSESFLSIDGGLLIASIQSGRPYAVVPLASAKLDFAPGGACVCVCFQLSAGSQSGPTAASLTAVVIDTSRKPPGVPPAAGGAKLATQAQQHQSAAPQLQQFAFKFRTETDASKFAFAARAVKQKQSAAAHPPAYGQPKQHPAAAATSGAVPTRGLRAGQDGAGGAVDSLSSFTHAAAAETTTQQGPPAVGAGAHAALMTAPPVVRQSQPTGHLALDGRTHQPAVILGDGGGSGGGAGVPLSFPPPLAAEERPGMMPGVMTTEAAEVSARGTGAGGHGGGPTFTVVGAAAPSSVVQKEEEAAKKSQRESAQLRAEVLRLLSDPSFEALLVRIAVASSLVSSPPSLLRPAGAATCKCRALAATAALRSWPLTLF